MSLTWIYRTFCGCLSVISSNELALTISNVCIQMFSNIQINVARVRVRQHPPPRIFQFITSEDRALYDRDNLGGMLSDWANVRRRASTSVAHFCAIRSLVLFCHSSYFRLGVLLPYACLRRAVAPVTLFQSRRASGRRKRLSILAFAPPLFCRTVSTFQSCIQVLICARSRACCDTQSLN
jgi:hypothetical protein